MLKRMQFELEIAGDSAVNLVVSREISPQASEDVTCLAAAIRKLALSGITDVVPTYCSVMVCYNPLVVSLAHLKDALSCLRQIEKTASLSGKLVEIPVAYGGVFGPDLDAVADHAGVSPEEVIRIHSSAEYPIAMLGFLPGFPYLSGLDERIHTPRLAVPRTTIPRGSVGIGGKQTGIYPLESPGGWQLIGRTPLLLFDPAGVRKIPYAAGDTIRFVPISEEEFYRIGLEQGSLSEDDVAACRAHHAECEVECSSLEAGTSKGDASTETLAVKSDSKQQKREPLARATYSFMQVIS